MPSSLSGRMAHSVMEELRMVLLDFYQMKKKMNRFCYELNTHSIFKQTKAQLNTVTIYSSPPQISINTVFFFCLVSLCMFFF